MPKKRRRHVIQTAKGRVVYDRKMHVFSDADLVRVFRAVIDRDEVDGYLDWLVNLVALLFKILVETLFRVYKETFPSIIAEFLIRILSELIKIVEALVGGAFNLISQALLKAFGLLTIKEATDERTEGDSAEGTKIVSYIATAAIAFLTGLNF